MLFWPTRTPRPNHVLGELCGHVGRPVRRTVVDQYQIGEVTIHPLLDDRQNFGQTLGCVASDYHDCTALFEHVPCPQRWNHSIPSHSATLSYSVTRSEVVFLANVRALLH